MNRSTVARFALRTGLAVAGCLTLVACASLIAGNPVPPFRDSTLSMRDAQQSVLEGETTQRAVLVALGPATEIKFDSGYTIWVYRAKAAAPDTDQAELVILFSPSGIVKKTRLRPPYTRHSAGSS